MTEQPSSRDTWRDAGILFLICAVYYWTNLGNYFFYQTSITELLTKIYADADELLIQDFMKAYYYKWNWPGFFALIPSWIYTTFHPHIKVLLESMGVILIALAATAMYSYIRAMGPYKPHLAILCVAYLLFSDMGYVSLSFWAMPGRLLQATYYGMALILLVIAVFMSGRYALSGFLLGVSISIHPGHGTVATGPLMAAFLIREWGNPKMLRMLVTSIACFFAGAAPYILLVLPNVTFFNYSNLPPGQIEKVMDLVKMKLDYHLFPSEWHPSRYVAYVTYLLLAWSGLRYLSDDSRRRFKILFWCYMFFIAVIFFCTEVTIIYGAIKLNPYRIFTHPTLMAMWPLFLLFWNVMADRARPFAAMLAFWTMACSFFGPEGIAIFPAWALLFETHVAPKLAPEQQKWRRMVLWGVMLLLPVVLFALPAGTVPIGPKRITAFLFGGFYVIPDMTKIVILLVAAVSFAVLTAVRAGDRRVVWICAGAVLFFVVIKAGYLRNNRMQNNPRLRAYYEAQCWAYGHTPKEAIFVSDPQLNGFRDYARREIFVFWIDAVSCWQNPRVYEEVVKRLNALTIDLAELKNVNNKPAYVSHKFSQLDPDVFRSVQRDFPRCQYVIYQNERNPRIELPVAFQNDFFTICRIE